MIDNNPGTEQKLLTQADFNNPEVLNTINPHPTFGYFHGPITNLKLKGIPLETAPPNATSYINPIHSVVCEVVVGENGEI
ncbi:hypothetical protein N7533_001134 [Penicillium manginii]|uniref:uncharacterized protein n=1 Tax=Penicillium manginii TaxID=203109 RepID=UPI0025468F00|nr:uncharacterized protein N7533_001134 [Penicillium manginii]KAJ5768551.1 hypothetical protein N7533_001134 [Penicillium manginii]